MTSFRIFAAACAASLTLAGPLAAGDAASITVIDPYARSSSPAAKSGAVFMTQKTAGPEDDRLAAAEAPAAERGELHTHLEDANGVMRMIEVEDGFAVPAGGGHMLERGGDHVMLMGLTESLEDGESFPLTLVFEEAGEVVVEVPVDLTRQPEHGDHGGMNH